MMYLGADLSCWHSKGRDEAGRGLDRLVWNQIATYFNFDGETLCKLEINDNTGIFSDDTSHNDYNYDSSAQTSSIFYKYATLYPLPRLRTINWDKIRRRKSVKLFSSALKRTLRSGASGLSIAAAASIQQKPLQQNKSATLLVRSAERRMHSKVVSEYARSPADARRGEGLEGCQWRQCSWNTFAFRERWSYTD